MNNNGGMGFIETLTIVFITLKIVNVITWSWFWVLCPIWISLLLFMFFAIISLITLNKF